MQPTEAPQLEAVEALDIGLRRRRRPLAPGLAVAAVLALALAVTVLALRGSNHSSGLPAGSGGTQPAGSSLPPGPSVAAQSTSAAGDPQAAAQAKIQAALDSAPLPASAVSSDTDLPSVKDGFSTSASPNEVRKSLYWTAPGTVDAAISYLRNHPPAGMMSQSYGSGSDGQQDIEFATTPDDPSGYPVELDYYLAPYGSGVALRVDAWTTWVPARPDWSIVPADATSVDLTVVREAYNVDPPGAPTVQRTLTGDALAQLADTLNALPSRAPEGVHSCPAMLVRASELAVFHTPAGDIRVTRQMDNCSFNATITAPPRTDEAYVSGNDFTEAVLSALGLPSNYGLH